MSDSQRETAVGNIGALVAGGDSGSSADFQGPDVPFWLIWGLMLLAGLIVVYLILDSRDLITQDLFS